MSPNSSHAPAVCLWVTRVLQTIHDLSYSLLINLPETEIKDQGDRQGWTNEAMISKKKPRTVSLRRIMCFFLPQCSLIISPLLSEGVGRGHLSGRKEMPVFPFPATIKILVTCHSQQKSPLAIFLLSDWNATSCLQPKSTRSLKMAS